MPYGHRQLRSLGSAWRRSKVSKGPARKGCASIASAMSVRVLEFLPSFCFIAARMDSASPFKGPLKQGRVDVCEGNIPLRKGRRQIPDRPISVIDRGCGWTPAETARGPVKRGILFVRQVRERLAWAVSIARLRRASFSTARWRALQCLPEIVHQSAPAMSVNGVAANRLMRCKACDHSPFAASTSCDLTLR